MSFFNAELDSKLQLDDSISEVLLHFVDVELKNVVRTRNLKLIDTLNFDYCIVVAIKGERSKKDEQCKVLGILDKDGNVIEHIQLKGWKAIASDNWKKTYYGNYVEPQSASVAFSILDPMNRLGSSKDHLVNVLNDKNVKDFLFNVFFPLSGYNNYAERLIEEKLLKIEAKIDVVETKIDAILTRERSIEEPLGK